MFQQTAKLRLNLQHPLCKPDVDLRFCTFWTGTQWIDDLVNDSYKGVIRAPHRQRILPVTTTESAGNLPKHIGTLAMRSDVTHASEYVNFVEPVGYVNPTRITSLVDGFTFACWIRPWAVGNWQIPVACDNAARSAGWLFVSQSGTGAPWSQGAPYIDSFGPSGVNSYVADHVLALGVWTLVVCVFSMSGYNYYGDRGVCFNINGVPVARSYTSLRESQNSGAEYFRVGTYYVNPTTYSPNCDMGPIMIWNSMLTYEQIALLYRDTWGMVQPEISPALRNLQSYIVSSFHRSNGMMLTEVG